MQDNCDELVEVQPHHGDVDIYAHLRRQGVACRVSEGRARSTLQTVKDAATLAAKGEALVNYPTLKGEACEAEMLSKSG